MIIKESLSNLKIIFEILDEIEVEYFVFFGTLLGVIRNRNLIEHDTDTDIFIKKITKSQIDYLSKKLIENKFDNFKHTDQIISYKRNNEYTDLYLFKLSNNLFKCHGFTIPRKYVENVISIRTKGLTFKVPKNYKECLDLLYGLDWHIEIKQYNAKPGSYKYGRTNSYFLYILAYKFPNFYRYLFNFKEGFRLSSPIIYNYFKKLLEKFL